MQGFNQNIMQQLMPFLQKAGMNMPAMGSNSGPAAPGGQSNFIPPPQPPQMPPTATQGYAPPGQNNAPMQSPAARGALIPNMPMPPMAAPTANAQSWGNYNPGTFNGMMRR